MSVDVADPLDKLVAQVTKRFSDAKNQDLTPPSWPSSPFTEKELKVRLNQHRRH